MNKEPVLTNGQIKRIRRPKHDINEVAAAFKKAGCELLDKTYLGTKQQLRYRCKCGSIRFTNYNNFSRGHECMKCHLKKFEKSRQSKKLKIQHRARLFTITDLANIMGVDLNDLYRAIHQTKIVPPPTRDGGSVRKYYNEQDIQEILESVELVQ